MNIQKMMPRRVNELYRSSLRVYRDLNGTWDFDLDPENTGEARGIPGGNVPLNDSITVPGCLEAQGKGLTYGPIVQPDWSGTSDIPYFGASWHRKVFALPEISPEKRYLLNFGGVATDCAVWLNGEHVLDHHYGSVSFGADVTRLLRGGDNLLVVKVENNHTYDERTPSSTHGFGSSTTEMRWSGIYRGVELVEAAKVMIDDIFIRPNAKQSAIEVEYTLIGEVPANASVKIDVTGNCGEYSALCAASENGSLKLDMPGARLWSDDDPALYRLTATLICSGVPVDSISERFGLRDIAYDGRHILLNGAPVYLRGEMTHFHWPGSISPCTDRDDLREKLGVYKAYGMNFMRHHTFCPHDEYLQVCDELGLLCHSELGVASNSWPIDEGHGPAMWQASVKAGRNNPSVIIWCMGNEYIHESVDRDLPDDNQMALYKQLTFDIDDTRLLQDNSPGFFHFPCGEKLKAPIHHELRKSGASYIDPTAKRHYTGALRPWRMLWAEEKTAAAGIDRLLPTFVRNTQKLQALCRKHVLEETRLNAESSLDQYYRSPVEYQGYELSTFRDSGSFVWGTVDDYCAPKAVSADEFREYNSSSVLLWGVKWWDRLYVTGKTECFLPVALSCSFFEKQPARDWRLSWTVSSQDGARVADGERSGADLAPGEVASLCDDRWYLPDCKSPAIFTLSAKLKWAGGEISNSWPFWCFPVSRQKEPVMPIFARDLDWELKTRLHRGYPFILPATDDLPAQSLLICGKVSEALLTHLENGGRALLTGRDNFPGEATEWNAARSEYARGTILDRHPLADIIPHDGFCDIPYHGMISGRIDIDGKRRNECGFVVGMRGWPKDITPIIAGIPSYKDPAPQLLSHLFEVNVGKGKLLITTLDFGSFSAQNPATTYFLDQTLRYLQSDAFCPKASVTAGFLREISQH